MVSGIDGDHVDRQRLFIPSSRFIAHDLETQLPVFKDRQFDLAICLEVAEHLTPERGPNLIRDLIRLAPAVLFSAAIPGQGGTGHVNEQWPDYWAEQFSKHGYRWVDCIRFNQWENADISFWYRQNLLLYVSSAIVDSNPQIAAMIAAQSSRWPLRVVHPELHESRSLENVSLKQALRILPSAFVKAIAWRLRHAPKERNV